MKKLFTMCVMLCCVMAAMAQEFTATTAEGYWLRYGIIDAGAKEVECLGLDGVSGYENGGGGSADLVIPEKVRYNNADYTVTSIGYEAFYYCSGFTGALTIPAGVTSIGDYAFRGCSGFTGSLTIPAGVTSIGSSAFYNCSGFTGSLTIPAGVESIGEFAFKDCDGFTGSLTIPAGVESIGSSAFDGCSGFTGGLTIPDGVTSIGDYAFSGCYGLLKLTVLCAVPPTLGDKIFNAVYLKAIYVPQGTRTAYMNAQGWKDFINELLFMELGDTEVLSFNVATANTLWDELDAVSKHPSAVTRMKLSGTLGTDDWALIKNNMTALYDLDLTEITNTEIPSEAFKESKIVHFKFPQELTSTGRDAFHDSNLCGNLDLPASLTSIGYGSFYGCRGLMGTLTIPNSVTMIDHYAFKGCSGFIGAVKLPDGLRSVKSGILSDCDKITHVIMPAKVTSIDPSAFFGCTALDTLTYLGVNPVVLSENFWTIDPTTCLLQVPTGARSNYARAVVWGNFLNIQEIEVGASRKLVRLRINEGGTVHYEGEAVANNHMLSIEENTMFTLNIMPQVGYSLKNITLAGEDVTVLCVDGVLTTPAVTEDMILNIEFTVETFDVSLFVEGGTARYATVVDYGTKVAYRIGAEENYEIESVSVNGDDVTSDLDEEGMLTIEDIRENIIVLVKTRSIDSSIPQASAEADFTAWGAQRTIYVEATRDMEQVRVIDLEGRMVHTAAVSAYSVMQVQMPQSGVYVVQAEMKDGTLLSQKVMVND